MVTRVQPTLARSCFTDYGAEVDTNMANVEVCMYTLDRAGTKVQKLHNLWKFYNLHGCFYLSKAL